MSDSKPRIFEASRCNEILESAIERNGGYDKLNKDHQVPLEGKILAILAFKSQLIFALPPDQHAWYLTEFNKVCGALCPELSTDEGIKTYSTVLSLFSKDIKDIVHGRI